MKVLLEGNWKESNAIKYEVTVIETYYIPINAVFRNICPD